MALAGFDLAGKVALVTGGNSGIGAGIAHGLAQAGASVAIWGRRKDRNAATAAEIAAQGGRVVAQVVDVRDEQQVIAGTAEVVEELGRIDCVVPCAGFARRKLSVLDVGSAEYHELLDTNLHGAFYVLKAGFAHMKSRAEAGDPGGSLIAIGSLMSHTALPGLPHYAIAKSGLAGLTRSLAVEGGPYGIRANMVCPGYIHTPPSEERATNPDFPVTRMLREKCPVPRWGRPEDFQGIACYLMSDASSYHSGDVITIDGGLLAKTPD